MNVMRYWEFQIARFLIRAFGLRVGLRLYNLIASDTRRAPELTVGTSVLQPAGYDISHWKEVSDWYGITPHPYIMGTKATQSIDYRDPTFIEYFQNFKNKVHTKRLAYHFFEKTQDAVRQANWFCDYIAPYLAPDDWLCLDFEQGGETADQLWNFLNRCHIRFPQNPLITYSRKNLYDPITMTAGQITYFKELPTWPAGYPSNWDGITTCPPGYIPRQDHWGKVGMWQYTDQAPVNGIVNGCDGNLLEPWFVELLGGSTPPPSNGGNMPTKTGKVIVGALNVRRQPNTNNTTNPPIGSLKLNDIITSDFQTADNWWRLKSITRAGAAVVLPATECYSSGGSGTAKNIEEITPPPPNTAVHYTIKVAQDGYLPETVELDLLPDTHSAQGVIEIVEGAHG